MSIARVTAALCRMGADRKVGATARVYAACLAVTVELMQIFVGQIGDISATVVNAVYIA